MRKKLTPAFIKDAALPVKGDRVVYWDATMPSFGLMVTRNGTRSFVYQYRNALHQSRRMTWAARIDGEQNTGLTLTEAHKEAKKLAGDVEKGADPVEEQREERRKAATAADTTLKAICEDYFAREAGLTRDADGNATFSGKSHLRSAAERLKTFERLILPKLGKRPIEGIKRSDVVSLLDEIEEKQGASMAHTVLAFLSRLFNWHAARTDAFHSPVVRGMGRIKPRERVRDRDLADDEIRDIWTALDRSTVENTTDDIPACFAKLVRLLLLTGLRRTEAARISWSEIEHLHRANDESQVLTIPGARMKGKRDHAVPLTAAAFAIIGNRPEDAKVRPFVLSTTAGKRPFSGYSKAKAALDLKIARLRKKNGREPMPQWQLHDLRRTAKTLMQRAGVRPDISERVLAHLIAGVEGVYDKWSYLPEKRDALERLAVVVDKIINPPAENVVTFPRGSVAAAAS